MSALASIPMNCPWPFWLVALAWSAFQSYAGFHYGVWIYNVAHRDKDGNLADIDEKVRDRAYGAHHAAFYALCSLSGFVAWSGLAVLARHVDTWSSVSGGTATLMVALGVFTVAGISGALPRSLFLGNRPV
ncbi:MAG: hypothetical protein U9Q74_08925 [Gemmatimonadota bacterium]|nr:hypothetical protein [Gemmatimonadota bacterium]